MSEPSTSERDRIEKLADSFMASYRAGQRPSVDAYVEQYPELAGELRGLIAALIVLERNAPRRLRLDNLRVEPTVHAPREIGEFTILREIGRGGMGVVYEAIQQSLGRHVALKVLSPGNLLHPTHLERFRLEARSAGRLHHSHIVPVFDVGESDGLHYYAMQFIAGQSLDQVIHALRKLRPGAGTDKAAPMVTDELTHSIAAGLLHGEREVDAQIQRCDSSEPAEPLVGETSPVADDSAKVAKQSVAGQFSSGSSGRPFYESVARVGLQVAEALAYAHGEGILHRDIKPSNLLLDAKGDAWVTDFGLVKADDTQSLTETGDFVGTLRYMAPERLEGWSDRRSDIYSLGATLYELLTLSTFFGTANRGHLIDQIRHKEPERPTRIDSAIPRDLETIVLKALAKEPASRYHSADEIAEDLRRFLADRPILARRATSREQLVRWCRRNRLVASLTATAIGLLVSAVAILAVGNVRILRESQEKAVALREKDEALKVAQQQELLAKRRLVTAQLNQAAASAYLGDLADTLAILEKQRSDEAWTGALGFGWRYLWRACHAGQQLRLRDGKVVTSVAYSLDGKLLASGNTHGGVMLWEASTGRLSKQLANGVSAVRSIAFSPNGQTIAIGSDDGKVNHWDIESSELLSSSQPHEKGTQGVAFSPDGKLLASAGAFRKPTFDSVGEIVIAEAGSGREVARYDEAGYSLTFSPDGKTLAVTQWFNGLELLDVATGQKRHIDPQFRLGAKCAVFSPDGSSIAVSGPTGEVHIVNLASGDVQTKLRGGSIASVLALAYPGNGTRLACGRSNGIVDMWELATDRLHTHAHGRRVNSLAFSPDGQSLASGSSDGTVKVWDGELPQEPETSDGHTGLIWSIRFSPDGRTLASASDDTSTKLWDVASGRVLATLKGASHGICCAFSPDGRLIAAGAEGNDVQIWDIATGEQRGALKGHNNGVFSVAFSPDGRILASGSVDATVKIWDVSTNAELATLKGHRGAIWSVAFSPDGKRLASACNSSGDVRLWDVTSYSLTRVIPDAYGVVNFLRDGRTLETRGGKRQSLLLWDLVNDSTRTEVAQGLVGTLYHVAACAPDGSAVMVSGEDGSLREIDVATGDERVLLPSRDGPVHAIAYSPDGNTVVTGNRSGQIRFWRAASDREIAEQGTTPVKAFDKTTADEVQDDVD